MTRKQFLKLIGVGVGASVAGVEATKASKMPEFQTWYCIGGTDLSRNLEGAKNLARKKRCDVIFVFNYDNYYLVKPSGNFIFKKCKRPRGFDLYV